MNLLSNISRMKFLGLSTAIMTGLLLQVPLLIQYSQSKGPPAGGLLLMAAFSASVLLYVVATLFVVRNSAVAFRRVEMDLQNTRARGSNVQDAYDELSPKYRALERHCDQLVEQVGRLPYVALGGSKAKAGQQVILCVDGETYQGIRLDKSSAYITSTQKIMTGVEHMWPLAIVEDAEYYIEAKDDLESEIATAYALSKEVEV